MRDFAKKIPIDKSLHGSSSIRNVNMSGIRD